MINCRTMLTLLLFFFTAPLFSLTIETIEIQGELSKTRRQTILDIIGFHEGDRISDEDMETIKQDLIKSGLFVNESIQTDLQINDDSADLILTLDDRFSLLPIPMVMYGDGGLTGGLFVMDMNFLGTGDQIYTGFLYGENMQFATASYMNKSLNSSNFDLGFNFGFSNKNNDIKDIEEKKLNSYESLSFKGGILSTWKSDPYSITSIFETEYSTYDFLDSEVMSYSPQVRTSFDKRYFQQYMSRGFQASAGYGFTAFGSDFDPVHTVTGSAVWELLPAERIKVSSALFSHFYYGDIYHAPSPESNLYSPLTRAESFAEARFKTTFVLVDFSWAYLAMPLSYNLAWLDGFSGDNETAHGPGAGLSLFLKEIAIPAVSFKYTRNLETNNDQISFTIGMGG